MGAVLLLSGLASALVVYALAVVQPQVAPLSSLAQERIQQIVAQHHSAYLALDQMGGWLPRATIAVEDRRFYGHGAVDLQAAARALLFDVRGGRPLQGGATIDVQLAERLLPSGPVDPLTRVLRVLLLAQRLDQLYGKRGVLALYLNDIYYGRGAYGAAAAARVFFDLPPTRLTPSQAAFLAGLPNAPAVYGDHPTSSATRARWQIVLRSLVHAHDLTALQAEHLVQAGVPYR